jgi:2-iminobutanoate/2-iminopropanoate deaminase
MAIKFYVSGQVGVDSRGKLQAGIEKQVEQVWKNIGQVLKSGGMGFADVVKVNVFLTDSRFIPAYRTIRDRFFAKEPYPASTLLIVQGLADPGMLVEVEVVAAK